MGMTGFDGEGWPWIASRARFTARKTGSTKRNANGNSDKAYAAMPLAA